MYKRWIQRILPVLLICALGFAPSAALADSNGPPHTPPGGLEPVVGEDGQPIVIENYQLHSDRLISSNEYFVQLDGPSVADVWLETGRAATRAHHSSLVVQQSAIASEIQALGGQVLATYQRVYNGLAIHIGPEQVDAVRALPGVVSVSPVPLYQTMLDETVSWIGAQDIQNAGFDGTGIRVAVIDSGIDYTHEHLGGSGLQADTNKALAQASQAADPALYPSAKVVGGYDFVGSQWTGTTVTTLSPDPNPMDDQAGGINGHGTHVASIIAGVKTAKLGQGVAPGAQLYALKVCSSVSTSCSGVAIQQALDWSSDPNGDLFFDDRVDVVNMSLGSIYGQANAATDVAVARLSALGSVIVVSAGNSANLPYIVGSPSSTRAAISVAQSSVPSSRENQLRIDAPAAIAQQTFVVHYSWSAAWTSTISGTVHYVGHTGCNTNPTITGVSGKIALIDRGGCGFSDKVYNAQQAGAIAAVVGLVAPGLPFAGSQASHYGQITIPGFNIAQAPSKAMKDAESGGATVEVTLDPSLGALLTDTMVGSSSRGPRFDLDYLKPDISAPGASVSANSGNQGYSVFGGTSGAAPMVAGAAALVLQEAGGTGSLTSVQVKARLMNNAVTTTWEDRPGGKLNPISRQGAGRVDVANAAYAETLAWVPGDRDVALSFGAPSVSQPYQATKSVEVVNTGSATKNYDIGVTYRYTNDIGMGVTVQPSVLALSVPAGGKSSFDVTVDADPAGLRPWSLDRGSRMNDGNRLTDLEVDGYVTLTETTTYSVTNVPFHFLPQQAAQVAVGAPSIAGVQATVPLTNSSPLTGSMELYPLFDISPRIPAVTGKNVQPVDIHYVGADVFPLSPTENLLVFAIGSYERRSHPYNVEYDVYIDADQDGLADYIVLNGDAGTLSGGAVSGQQVSALFDLATGTLTLQYSLDGRLNSDNMVLLAGVPDDDLAFNFYVRSFDAYYGGPAWDISPLNASAGVYHIYDGSAAAFWADTLSQKVGGNLSASSVITSELQHASPSQIGMLYRTFNGPAHLEMQAVKLPTLLPAGVGLSATADKSSILSTESVDVTTVLTFGVGVAWSGQPVYLSDGTFSASLNGANEAPTPVTSSGVGTATLTYDAMTGQASYTLDVTGLTGVTAAHIHRGAAGVAGGVAVPLNVNSGTTFPVTGTVTLSEADAMLLVSGELYVNVHTSTHTGGEIRGQLVGGMKNTTDSAGRTVFTWTPPTTGQWTLWAYGGGQRASVRVDVYYGHLYLPMLAR